jgi:hypothetical protein
LPASKTYYPLSNLTVKNDPNTPHLSENTEKKMFFLDYFVLRGYTVAEDRVVRRKVLISFQAFLR